MPVKKKNWDDLPSGHCPAGNYHRQRRGGRRRATLTVRRQQLLRWGYPYVFEEFRFHLTLAGSIADEREKEIIRRFLEDYFAEALRAPVVVDRISLFVEDETQLFHSVRIARQSLEL